MGQHSLRACQQHPKQLPLPQRRQQTLLGCLAAPGTLLPFTANSKSKGNKTKGFFLGPLRASAIRAGHSSSGTAEPVRIPPGAGKALARAGEPRNGALPKSPPPTSWVSEQGCPEGFLLSYPVSGAPGIPPPNQRDPKAASAQQEPVAEATGRQGCVPRRVTPQGRDRALQHPGTPPARREPETPPLTGEFTAGNRQSQTGRCWRRGRTGHPAARGPAMQVMKAPENEKGWYPSVSRAGATEPTAGSVAADMAPVARLIAGGWGRR